MKKIIAILGALILLVSISCKPSSDSPVMKSTDSIQVEDSLIYDSVVTTHNSDTIVVDTIKLGE